VPEAPVISCAGPGAASAHPIRHQSTFAGPLGSPYSIRYAMKSLNGDGRCFEILPWRTRLKNETNACVPLTRNRRCEFGSREAYV
jgi:hypothetical protein